MKKLDTAELLAEEDEKILNFILAIKQNISGLIGIDVIIDELREIIKGSEHFSFRSKRNEKIISKTRPLFVLMLDTAKFKNDIGHNFGQNGDIDIVRNLVQDEITSVFSRALSDKMKDEEFMHQLLIKANIGEIGSKALTMLPFITSSIFSINVELNTGLVYLEYVF